MERQKNRSFEPLTVTALLVLTAVLYVAGMENNHRWWGDFSLYLGHAKNIAELQPYSDTGYIPNPYRLWLSPLSYPPVYPYLLAPVYKIFGLNLLAAKLLNLGLFLATIWFFYRYIANRLTQPSARLGTAILLAMSPWFWSMKDLILSDIPFVFFTVVAIALANRFAQLEKGDKYYWPLSITLGICCYLAYGTRSLGLALPVTILLYDLLFLRKIRQGTLVALAVFLGLFSLQQSYLDVNSSYTGIMVNHAERTVSETEATNPVLRMAKSMLKSTVLHLKKYPAVLQEYWDNGSSLELRLAMGLISGFFALTGFITLLSKKLLPSEIFSVVYFGILLVVPFYQGYRYLLPVIPFFIMYMFHGVERFATFFPKRATFIVPLAVLLSGAASHAGYYSQMDPKTVSHGVLDTDAVKLYDYIKSNTPVDSVIIFKRPRILALFTKRHSATYVDYLDNCQSLENFQQLGATHLLIKTGIQQKEKPNQLNLIEQPTGILELVYENPSFKLYKFSSLLMPECDQKTSLSHPQPTS